MRELFDTELNLTDQPMGQDELLDALQRAEVLVPTITDRIDSRLLSRAGPSLKLIANFGAGVDNIDVETATEKGIIVVNSPEGNTIAAAEHTLALMMSLARQVTIADKSCKENKWNSLWPRVERV